MRPLTASRQRGRYHRAEPIPSWDGRVRTKPPHVFVLENQVRIGLTAGGRRIRTFSPASTSCLPFGKAHAAVDSSNLELRGTSIDQRGRPIAAVRGTEIER